MEIKKLRISILLVLITQFLTFSISHAATADDLRAAIEAKAKGLLEINNQIQTTQKQLEQTQGQQKTLSKEIKNIDYGISQLNLGIKSSQINIEKLGLELQEVQLDINQINASIGNRKLTLVKLLRELYEKDKEGSLIILLKNKSLAESLLESETISGLNQGISSEVADLTELNKQLNARFQTTSSKKKNIETENGNLKNRKGIVEDQKKERATLLTQTKNQEKLFASLLSDLERKQSAISDEIDVIEDELRKSFDPSILPVKRPGVLSWPVASPVLTQHFGEVSYLYRGKPHNGMDLGMPIGTAIFASADGTVFATGNNGRYQYGKYVMVRHDNNLITLYAHLSNNLIVKKGDVIKRGQLVGYSGNTGYVVGRGHLHLGLYWEPSVRLENRPDCNCGLIPIGITIDPEPYLGN